LAHQGQFARAHRRGREPPTSLSEHRALETRGIIVHEINGMPDHVHMAVSIPPTVTPSEWIGEMKGASSHHINHEICNRKVLAWQDGYGIVSFGTKDLRWVVTYIRNQKTTMPKERPASGWNA